jgi:hypothetical protein
MLLDKATDIVEEVRRTIVLERLEVSAGGPSRSPNSLLVPGYRLFLTPTQWALLVFCNRYAGAPSSELAASDFENDGLGAGCTPSSKFLVLQTE